MVDGKRGRSSLTPFHESSGVPAKEFLAKMKKKHKVS